MKKLLVFMLFSSITYASQYQFVKDWKREEVPSFLLNLDFKREEHFQPRQYDFARRMQANRIVKLAGVRIDNLQPQMRQRVKEFHYDIVAKASVGNLEYFRLQAEEARSNLRKPGLSSNDRIYENIRLKMIRSIESSPVIQSIHAFKTGTLDAARKAYQAMESLYDQRKIDSNTWQKLQKIYRERQDVFHFSAQLIQAPQEDVPNAVTLHSPEIVPVKLADVTDMTTDKPTRWYGSELSAEKTALFAAYHQEVHEALIREGLIDQEIPYERAVNAARLYVETLAHELHPDQIKRDIDGIAQLASDVAQSALSPINGVRGRSHLGYPRVIAALEAGVDGAQEIARRLVMPMEGVTKSPLVQLLRAAGDLTPEQIAIISAKATADWIKFEALSTMGAYVSQADVLGKVREIAQRVEKGTLTAEEARHALIADGIVLDVGATESGAASAAESTSVLRSQSDKVRGASKASGAGKEAIQLSVAAEKLELKKGWFELADKVERRLPQARPGSVIPTDLVKYLKHEKDIEIAYEKIRQTDDVLKIAKNTGLPKDMIQRVKNHVFFETHSLDSGLMRFPADGDMAIAWKRLQENNALACDIMLLKHELSESILIKELGVNVRQAHEVTDVLYNWVKSYK